MTFKEKSSNNCEAAKYLYDSGYFNACINRYYYSIFQYGMHILQQIGVEFKEEDKQSKGSHDKTFESIVEYVKRANKKNVKQAIKIRSNYDNIKKFRKKADYTEEILEKKSANIVISTYNELITLLKNIR